MKKVIIHKSKNLPKGFDATAIAKAYGIISILPGQSGKSIAFAVRKGPGGRDLVISPQVESVPGFIIAKGEIKSTLIATKAEAEKPEAVKKTEPKPEAKKKEGSSKK